MKYFLNFIILISLLASCDKGKNTESPNPTNSSLYQIKTVKGFDKTTEKHIELQIYESVNGDKFINQVKEFKNEEIDSSNSYFYTLELSRIEPNLYKGKIQLMYENENILGIDFKTITKVDDEYKISTFNSTNSDLVLFNITNTDLSTEIKGVLCIKIETEILIEDKIEEAYYMRYMFVDNKEETDNLFIKKYKKIRH